MVLLFPFFVIISSTSQARWANEKDAATAVNFQEVELQIHSDGTYEESTDQELQVLKEHSRTELGSRRLYYNSNAAQLRVRVAETINGDERKKVPSKFIEDKPLASSGVGFDQHNQVLIAFPDVQIGTRIHLKYDYESTKAPLEGFFSQRIRYDSGELLRSDRIHVVSEIPIFLEVNDPRKSLDITQSHTSHGYEITIHLTHPIVEAAVDEEHPSLAMNNRTWVVLSTSKDYGAMAAPVLPKYEKIVSAELPDLFRGILESAQKKSTTVDRINAVTSQLAEAVRYMGDWRPVQGGHVPRTLEAIAASRFGDCKDFSASTVAILRKLGMEAHVAWVERGIESTPIPRLALDSAFNHAIVFAKSEGKTYWVDPTNFQSFAQGTFPDIQERDALVMNETEAHLERIPSGNPGEALTHSRFEMAFDENGDTKMAVHSLIGGRNAISLTGATLMMSKETIDHYFTRLVANESRLKRIEIADYDLNSRIVKDLGFDATLEESYSAMKTSAGLAYRLVPSEVVQVLVDLETKKRISELFLGQPFSYQREIHMNHVHVIGSDYRGCDLKSPWAQVSRKLLPQSDGVLVQDRYSTLVSSISSEDLKSAEFHTFQARLRSCMDQVAIVFKPLKGSGALRKLASPKAGN